MSHSDAASARDAPRFVQIDSLAFAIDGIRDVQARLMDKPVLGLADAPDIQRAIDHLRRVADSLKT